VEGEGGGGGERGEMAKTMYAHMNKRIKKYLLKCKKKFDKLKLESLEYFKLEIWSDVQRYFTLIGIYIHMFKERKINFKNTFR
jgi:hypothetical protein